MKLGSVIKGLLFDKDGTLLDFSATWLPVLREAAETAAGPHDHHVEGLLSLGGYDHASGRVAAGSLLAASNTEEIEAAWAEHLGRRPDPALVAKLDQVFQTGGARHSTPVTELRPLFLRLKARGLVLGVATSDSRRGAEASLAPHDVFELFDFVAGYDSGHGVKPEPGMVQAFVKHTGLSVESIAMVGDNLHDMEMGRRAGVGLVIGVLTGNSTAEDLAGLADHVLDSIADIESVLE